MNVFEFGSGGSTVYLGSRVKNLVSVEHDPTWHEAVTKDLKERGLLNVNLLLREPEQTGSIPPAEYRDNYGTRYANLSFERYVKSIDEYPDRYFDLVLIDRPARKGCMDHAIRKIHPNGYLVLDDSSTKEYLEFLSPLEN